LHSAFGSPTRQLHRSLDLLLFPLGNITSDRLRCTVDGFGYHFDSSQNFQLLAAMIEGSLLTHQGLPAAHPGRAFCPLNIQFGIDRKLAGVTAWA
jgi:hypothetical protein